MKAKLADHPVIIILGVLATVLGAVLAALAWLFPQPPPTTGEAGRFSATGAISIRFITPRAMLIPMTLINDTGSPVIIRRAIIMASGVGRDTRLRRFAELTGWEPNPHQIESSYPLDPSRFNTGRQLPITVRAHTAANLVGIANYVDHHQPDPGWDEGVWFAEFAAGHSRQGRRIFGVPPPRAAIRFIMSDGEPVWGIVRSPAEDVAGVVRALGPHQSSDDSLLYIDAEGVLDWDVRVRRLRAPGRVRITVTRMTAVAPPALMHLMVWSENHAFRPSLDRPILEKRFGRLALTTVTFPLPRLRPGVYVYAVALGRNLIATNLLRIHSD